MMLRKRGEERRGGGMRRGRHARPRTLAAIALLKLAKAALLFAVGFGFFKLLNPDLEQHVVSWAHSLAWSYNRGLVEKALTFITGLDDHQLKILGIGAFATGFVFVVEGTGLWFAQRWAEYLTLVVTTLLLPVEIYELLQKFSIPRLSGFLFNVLVAAYLFFVVSRSRRQEDGRDR